jgi:hypothetical protein
MDDKIKATDEERLDYCTTAASAEHARAWDENEPCDDGRTGNVAPAQHGSSSLAVNDDNKKLCEKIKALHPEIGKCGIDINVNWDMDKKVWIIDFKSGRHELTTPLAPEDANACMEDRQCPALALKIANLKATIIKG